MASTTLCIFDSTTYFKRAELLKILEPNNGTIVESARKAYCYHITVPRSRVIFCQKAIKEKYGDVFYVKSTNSNSVDTISSTSTSTSRHPLRNAEDDEEEQENAPQNQQNEENVTDEIDDIPLSQSSKAVVVKIEQLTVNINNTTEVKWGSTLHLAGTTTSTSPNQSSGGVIRSVLNTASTVAGSVVA